MKHINRRTFRVQLGKLWDCLALLMDEQKQAVQQPYTFRVLWTNLGPEDTVIMELGFATMDDYFKGWEAWDAQETTPAFMEQWSKIIEPGGTNEIWEVM